VKVMRVRGVLTANWWRAAQGPDHWEVGGEVKNVNGMTGTITLIDIKTEYPPSLTLTDEHIKRSAIFAAREWADRDGSLLQRADVDALAAIIDKRIRAALSASSPSPESTK
jgi:hypothetical protein